jgi:GGDEF domain-containing protein
VLYLRSRAIDDATTSELALRRHATGDPRTGLLSWEALCTLAPNVSSLAEVTGTGIHLALVRIARLDAMETDYGAPYADRVLTTVSRCLEHETRPGELLSRQGPSTFALLGLGGRDPEALRDHLERTLDQQQVSLGKRPIDVEVTVNTGSVDSVASLLA